MTAAVQRRGNAAAAAAATAAAAACCGLRQDVRAHQESNASSDSGSGVCDGRHATVNPPGNVVFFSFFFIPLPFIELRSPACFIGAKYGKKKQQPSKLFETSHVSFIFFFGSVYNGRNQRGGAGESTIGT